MDSNQTQILRINHDLVNFINHTHDLVYFYHFKSDFNFNILSLI